jgi:hypothetical protein
MHPYFYCAGSVVLVISVRPPPPPVLYCISLGICPSLLYIYNCSISPFQPSFSFSKSPVTLDQPSCSSLNQSNLSTPVLLFLSRKVQSLYSILPDPLFKSTVSTPAFLFRSSKVQSLLQPSCPVPLSKHSVSLLQPCCSSLQKSRLSTL